MSYGSSGTYSQVTGAITAAAGQTIQSALWNNIHTDIGNALTNIGLFIVTPTAPRNVFSANGGMEVWQRGTSVAMAASASAYGPDRCYLAVTSSQSSVVSRQTGLTSGSQYACRIQRNAGQAGVTPMIFGIPLDTDEVLRLRGNKVSLSFYAAAGASWSPASGTLTAVLYVGTGTVQKAGAAGANFTGATAVLTVAANLTAGGTAAVFGGISGAIVPVTATQAELQFTWTPVGSAGASDYVDIDNVMIDASPAPGQGFLTQFEQIPFEFQFRQCQVHYWNTFTYGTTPAQNVGAGTGELMAIAGKASSSSLFLPFRCPLPMRATASTVTLYNPSAANAQIRNETAGSDCLSSTSSGMTPQGGYITGTGATGSNIGDLIGIHLGVDASI